MNWWQKPEKASQYRDLYMKAINRLRFKSNVWQPVMEWTGTKDPSWMSDNYESIWTRVFFFVNEVRKLAGEKPMTREYFDEGRRYRCIFQKPYRHAVEQFWLLCWGDW